MNRYEANRRAKQIFMAYGSQPENVFEHLKHAEGFTDQEVQLVKDYYQRTVARVQDWLRL